MKIKLIKKKWVLILTLLLAFLFVCAVSYAWMITEETIENELDTPNIDIKLIEKFSPPDNWGPEEVIQKQVYVKNSGDAAALVRISLEEFLMIYELDLKTGNLDTKPDNNNTIIARDSPTADWAPGKLVRARYVDGNGEYQWSDDNSTPPVPLYFTVKQVFSTTMQDPATASFPDNRNPAIGPHIGFTWGNVGKASDYSAANPYDWVYEHGYFYYTKLLEPGKQTSLLLKDAFTTEQFPNAYKGGQYRLEIRQQGIVPSSQDSAAVMLETEWDMQESDTAYGILANLWQ